jgi:hypothetical protein
MTRSCWTTRPIYRRLVDDSGALRSSRPAADDGIVFNEERALELGTRSMTRFERIWPGRRTYELALERA